MKQLLIIILFSINLISCGQSNDKIIGIWDVKNNNYQATYEIVEHQNKFYGKIHYYHDGETEYKGTNKEKDYFLTGIEKKREKYINGKMYLPDGSYYNVIFSLRGDNSLVVLMTIEGKPYKEVWKRNTQYK